MVQDDISSTEGGGPQPCEAIICWDADTGSERWRFCYPGSYEERMGSGPRSTPLVAGGLVYAVGPTGAFHCLCADTGEKVWRHDLLEEFNAQRPRYGVSFSPLLDGELVFALPGGREGGSVAAFNARSGQLVWHALDDEAGYSSPVCATLGGVRQLLVLTNEALVSLSPTDGRDLLALPLANQGRFQHRHAAYFRQLCVHFVGIWQGVRLLGSQRQRKGTTECQASLHAQSDAQLFRQQRPIRRPHLWIRQQRFGLHGNPHGKRRSGASKAFAKGR